MKLAACVALLALFLLLGGCEFPPPEEVCVQKEMRTVMVPKMASPGMPSVGGLAPALRHVCVKWAHNPEYDRWVREHR